MRGIGGEGFYDEDCRGAEIAGRMRARSKSYLDFQEEGFFLRVHCLLLV